MPEEQTHEKKCKCKILISLVILSLLMSIASLTLSVLGYTGVITPAEPKKVVISEQYDKGKSLTKARETQKPILVFFYTDWCGFCQRFAPTFNKVSKDKKLKKEFAVAYVNCENPDNENFVKEFEISGFPSVFVVDKNGKKTQLDNAMLFEKDSKDTIIKKVFEIIK